MKTERKKSARAAHGSATMNTKIWRRFGRSALGGLALAAAAGLSGCDNATARVEPPPPKVSVQHPELRKVVDYDNYNGWLRATDTVDIRSRVRGHLDKIHFTDGDMVKKGQLLFELDPRPFKAEIGRASDSVNIYAAQRDAAAKDEARYRELIKTGAAGQSEVDISEAKRKSFDAQVEAAKQEVTRRELDLEYSKITSPLSGRIGKSNLSVGSLVNALGTDDILATIVSVDPIDIYFDIDERSLQRYMTDRRRSGETRPTSVRESKIPFKFQLETEKDYPNEGVLDFADNRVDPTTGTIVVRGVVKNPSGLFVPGTRVSIRVPVSDEHEVLLVPDTAILTDQSKKYLLVLDEKKVVQRRDIEPGKLLEDRSRVVLPGKDGKMPVKPDEWLITQGLQMARINYPVEPVMPAAGK
jgi:multidrug efflux system membrane fusion protein